MKREWTAIPKPRRILVTIDPEDREEVERLTRAHHRAYCDDPAACDPEEVTIMQAALRSFADPRPDEPTGLGAVVEGDDGRRFVNVGTAKCPWRHGATAYEWSEFATARVLTPGVTP